MWVRVRVVVVRECAFSFVVGAFLIVMLSGGDVGGFPVNGVLGFSTGALPLIAIYGRCARGGYVPGPRVDGCGSG